MKICCNADTSNTDFRTSIPISLVAGTVSKQLEILHERGYLGVFTDPQDYWKINMGKYLGWSFGQTGLGVP